MLTIREALFEAMEAAALRRCYQRCETEKSGERKYLLLQPIYGNFLHLFHIETMESTLALRHCFYFFFASTRLGNKA